ncbi:hypothetical protein HanRHA438_Chr17g0799831 [Helianthus annuus]|nr:hypothetical protein HanHA300_Chr17g0643571 [Helianthus annuus]KAJ0446521.1 hypothetical protein HanHA89_Chr17g0695151 [Helianthus annuus]KAJ0635342.1 hypothetical protein HanOQP8_Chr17g0649761 [Helianthus annuus]KAJ0825134.1 hypothetical protein HanRHA438_Chr17g0799831 [Helianthus annuus]
MMRKKTLEDKKRKIDEHAVASLAAKRAKLQKETPPAPSESEVVDLEAFTKKHGNLLEKIFVASDSRGTSFFICMFYLPLSLFPSEYLVYFETGARSGKTSRKVDVSKITPPASLPPSRVFGLSLSPDDLGEKKKPGDVKIELVGAGGAGGTGVDGGDGFDGGDGRGKGVETEAESSQATPRHTIYTKRPPGGGGGATSKVHQSPEFENVRAGSWDTHNPACDDLPHVPRWRLTQRSRMSDHYNCHEFFSLSLPPAERLFQKRRNWFDLLDDHIHAGFNFFATSQEIVREWKLMGEDTLEFENVKKAFTEEKEKFNTEKKGLLWRWEFACERTNGELQSQRDPIVRLSGQKKKISEEAEHDRVASQKREEEYLQRIAKLEKLAEEKIVESKASELFAEEVSADCKWLLAHAVPRISERIVKSHELANYMFELGQAVYNNGRKDGYSEGRAAAANNQKDYHFELYKEDCAATYAAKRRDYEFLEFGIVKAVDKLSRRANAIEILKKALGDSEAEGGAGPSHQD